MDNQTAATSPPTALTTRMLDVGDGHQVYVETTGNPSGTPALYLHGGPGSGSQPLHRGLFDPARFHAVLFDQRGAGRSTPKGSRDANTLQHLIADIELIRTTLGIDKWLVSGGSWGATLALAYAQAHPDRVSALVLRATFLATRDELNDAFLNALPRHYPTLYEDFLAFLPQDERELPLDAYWRRILHPDPAIHAPAALMWFAVESAMSEIKPARTSLKPDELKNLKLRPVSPYMEAHYFSHDSFLAPDQLTENAHKLRNIPGIIVQGRFDMLCPPSRSARLAEKWGNAEIRMVECAGHSLFDPGIKQAVIDATNALAMR